ncbi:MAG: eukaryotic-like serine/threonine-protein kinase [Verrucomicrobiota bacterium]|jgi:tetratricopeptide (TPR) repeat protein/tRNA A-37 threonylcarbamoyl transferase component Bud32
MKTISPGLSDSIASVLADPRPCPHCDSSSHIAGGLCVGCLLEAGLDPADAGESESLTDILAEINLPDQNWRLGNYEILEEIGRGGMGVIYRARQRHSRRIVAVKRVLSYHSDSRETLARFRREAQAAASLDHPNILPIYEVSESEDGLPFFSMKFAPGGTLQQVAPALRNEPRQCVALVAKIARAVQYAHGHGILHRDLKPGNILLDGRGEPLVSDFGLAKWLDTTSDLTRTLTIFGTPGYIAPEQASASAADLKPTADIYSLGAILFDLLAGRPPFLGAHALSVIRQAAELPAPKLRTLSKLADRDLETICARCLERDPKLRYPSAHDLAEDLERWLEGRPIIARRVSPPVRIWRWAKRTPKLAGSLAACLIFGGAAVAWQIESRRLTTTVREEQMAAHSVAVLPFLNLDDVAPDLATTNLVADFLRARMSALGLARVISAREPPAKWTGTGIHDEVQAIERQLGTVTVLSGTVRRFEHGKRLSLHLLKSDGTEAPGHWVIELDEQSAISTALIRKDVARSIYNVLDGHKDALNRTFADPGIQDDVARAYISAGRGLLDRRTIPDLDRAISCFEAAIRAAPKSVTARSYLAMACLGRNYLLSSPELTRRAQKGAREAIELAPDDPAANRALFFVAQSKAQYSEALEYGMRAIELGDPSERACGQIAYAWKMLGRPDTAILWYQKAKVSQEQPADYDALLGDCFTDLGLDEQARQAYQAAANFRPDLPEGWMGLCRLELLAGNEERAREICRDKLTTYSGSSVAGQMQGMVEFFTRNYAKAGSLYSGLLAEEREGGDKAGSYGSVNYLSALARIKMEQGDVASSRALAEECLAAIASKGSQDFQALYTVAAAEALRGQTENALTSLQSSIDKGWIDHRFLLLDPRFDCIRTEPRFTKILSGLAARVVDLRRHHPAIQLATNREKQNE